jgi:hypothetical protein
MSEWEKRKMMFSKGKDQSREDSLAGRQAFNINTAGLSGMHIYVYTIYVYTIYV